eukprot:6186882-Pleurochrysis_carterae.AAC.1
MHAKTHAHERDAALRGRGRACSGSRYLSVWACACVVKRAREGNCVLAYMHARTSPRACALSARAYACTSQLLCPSRQKQSERTSRGAASRDRAPPPAKATRSTHM